jgi:hypothetical protein
MLLSATDIKQQNEKLHCSFLKYYLFFTMKDFLRPARVYLPLSSMSLELPFACLSFTSPAEIRIKDIIK